MSEMANTRVLVTTTAAAVFVSVGLAAMEYYFVRVEGIPYREARLPTIGAFYDYQLFVFFPILGLLSLEQMIFDMIARYGRRAGSFGGPSKADWLAKTGRGQSP